MTQDWQVRTLRPAPAMTESVELVHGTYEDACEAARESYARTGRRSSVVTGTTYWFRVDHRGEVNRNTHAATR